MLAPRTAVLEVFPQPAQDQVAELAIAVLGGTLGLEKVGGGTPLLDGAEVHVHQVGGPSMQVVENVGGVDDGGVAGLGLALEPVEEARTRQHVEVDRDLVEQQHRPRPHQAHGQLDAPPLAVRHGVHAPRGVNVQHLDQLVAPRWVGVPTNRAEQLGDANVGAHDRVQHPLQPQVRHPLEALGEGVHAAHGDGAARGEALTCQEAEEAVLGVRVSWGLFFLSLFFLLIKSDS